MVLCTWATLGSLPPQCLDSLKQLTCLYFLQHSVPSIIQITTLPAEAICHLPELAVASSGQQAEQAGSLINKKDLPSVHSRSLGRPQTCHKHKAVSSFLPGTQVVQQHIQK